MTPRKGVKSEGREFDPRWDHFLLCVRPLQYGLHGSTHILLFAFFIDKGCQYFYLWFSLIFTGLIQAQLLGCLNFDVVPRSAGCGAIENLQGSLKLRKFASGFFNFARPRRDTATADERNFYLGFSERISTSIMNFIWSNRISNSTAAEASRAQRPEAPLLELQGP